MQHLDRLIDLAALGLEGLDALLELAQGLGVLGDQIVVALIEIEDVADLGQRQADMLAAQDEGKPRAVTIGVDARLAFAARRQQALLLVVAERPRGRSELAAELGDREGGRRTAKLLENRYLPDLSLMCGACSAPVRSKSSPTLRSRQC